jgi:hypothetical protein
LSDALGITTEDASRLQEVAGDLGIGTDAVAAALGRMNKTAATSPAKFKAIGAEMVRNKDGSLDVIKTFENVATALNNIPDPARRAKAASDIFGKGWMSIAELIKQGGQGIQQTLASVEAQKVFSPEQYSEAKALRDNLDELQGVAESAALVIGGKLAESLSAMVKVAIQVGSTVHDLGVKIQDMIPEGAQAAGFKWSALLSTWPDIAHQAARNFTVLKDAITGNSEEVVLPSSTASSRWRTPRMCSDCSCRSTVLRGLSSRRRTSVGVDDGCSAMSSRMARRSGGIESRAQRIARRMASGRSRPMATAPRTSWTSCLVNRVGISGAWASMSSPR